MNQIINDCLIGLNKVGGVFYSYAAGILVQSALLVILLFIIDLLLRKRVRAVFRYWLWLLVLMKLVLPPMLSLPTGIGYWVGDHIPAAADVSNRTFDTVALERARPSGGMPHVRPSENVTSENTTMASGDTGLTSLTWQAVVFLLWLAGVLAFLAVLVQRIMFVGGLVAAGCPAGDELTGLLEQCRRQMTVKRDIKLRLSEAVPSPAVCGLLSPVVLMPTSLVEKLSPEGLRAALIHELAHIKRGDLWVNSIQTFLQVVYFYNPFVWFANSMIRKVCEEAVDETVLVALGGQAKHYSNTLIDIGETVFWKADLGLRLIGVAESKKALQWRIRHMLNRPIPKSSKLGVLGIIVVIIIAAVLLPMARAQRPEPGSKPMTKHDTETALTTAPVLSQHPVFRKIFIPGNLTDAQLSPDGKSIAMAREGKLWIIHSDSTSGTDDPNAFQLVNTGEIKVDSYGLTWSGDGQWIAFNGAQPILDGKGEGNYRMYVVSAQGGKPREVYKAYRGGTVHNRQMSLSPNGEILAFSSGDTNELHIYTIAVKGGVPRRLVDTPSREPVFSPDGELITYVEDKDLGNGGGALWVVPTVGGTARRVADANNAWSPVWSPDGRMIAFFDWKGGKQICIIPVNEHGEPTGEKTAIDYPEETGRLYRLTGWTPDNKIGAIFQSSAQVGLYTLSPNSGLATLVTHTGRGGFLQPRWSPDGKRIIYMKWPGEDGSNWLNYGLASISAEGGEATMIPIESDTKISRASWGGGGSVSPDGKTIVFAGCKAQEAAADTMHIWTLPIEGGRATQLTNAPVPLTDKFPCWAPDGKAIAFVRSRDSKNIVKMFTEADICIIPSAGGEPRQLTSESDRVIFGAIAWSPDGKLLAYQSKDKEWSPAGNTLRVIPSKGGESRIVAKLQLFDGNNELAWSPDSRRIALNDGGIRIISLDDGRVADVNPGVAMTKSYHLDWSRDGAKLVFAGYQGGERGFWLMENFLRTSKSVKDSKWQLQLIAMTTIPHGQVSAIP
jgi:Tol biopolymer transport system component/beta-lactamase regulating signal transducer with metallopeptidase domain